MQIDTFKSDFQEERLARENLAGEKAGLEQKIRELKQEINSLESRTPPPTHDQLTANLATSLRNHASPTIGRPPSATPPAEAEGLEETFVSKKTALK